MTTFVQAPVEWVESVGDLTFSEYANRRLQELMDRNNEGLLSESDRAEMESLVELSERISLIRAGALNILGRKPE